MRGRWASPKMSPSRIPVPQIAYLVCISFSNIVILCNPELKHRAGIRHFRAEIPDPSHLCKFATARPDLYRVEDQVSVDTLFGHRYHASLHMGEYRNQSGQTGFLAGYMSPFAGWVILRAKGCHPSHR